MDEIYGFASFAFASLPYRFMFLTINNWIPAATLMGIKYLYKIATYFIAVKYKKELKQFKMKISILICKEKTPRVMDSVARAINDDLNMRDKARKY
jgi:hypothetical protein